MTTHGCSYRGSFLVEVDVLSKGLPNWKLAMAMHLAKITLFRTPSSFSFLFLPNHLPLP